MYFAIRKVKNGTPYHKVDLVDLLGASRVYTGTL